MKIRFAYLDLIRMRRGREGERGVIVLLNCQIMNSHCECVCQLGRRKLFMRVYISLFHLDSYHPPSSCLSTIFVGVSGKNLFSRKVIPIYFYTTLSHWMECKVSEWLNEGLILYSIKVCVDNGKWKWRKIMFQEVPLIHCAITLLVLQH